jgi:hypothetical protein
LLNVKKALTKILATLPTVTNITNIAANVTVLRGGYSKIGGLIVVNMVFRVSTNAFNADSILVGVPPAFQADAPLAIYNPSASPNTLSANCRIAGGYIRPGLALAANTEYTICGIYFWGGVLLKGILRTLAPCKGVGLC